MHPADRLVLALLIGLIAAVSAPFCTLPAWTLPTGAVTAGQLVGAATSGLGEAAGDNAAYSKFFRPEKAACPVSSRTGMCIIYLGGSALSLGWLVTEGWAGRSGLVAVALAVHYLKREFEVFAVHKYSGCTDLPVSGLISLFYGLCATGLLVYTENSAMESYGLALLVGWLAVLVGQCGNGYHHWLLSSMRKPGESKYSVPSGGLFDYVTCPHYLFELLSWWGVAVLSGSLFGFLNFASMCHYLGSRSRATHIWYSDKFGTRYPHDRCYLVPALF